MYGHASALMLQFWMVLTELSRLFLFEVLGSWSFFLVISAFLGRRKPFSSSHAISSSLDHGGQNYNSGELVLIL